MQSIAQHITRLALHQFSFHFAPVTNLAMISKLTTSPPPHHHLSSMATIRFNRDVAKDGIISKLTRYDHYVMLATRPTSNSYSQSAFNNTATDPDIEITCSSYMWKCHKLILRNASEWFQRAFASGFQVGHTWHPPSTPNLTLSRRVQPIPSIYERICLSLKTRLKQC